MPRIKKQHLKRRKDGRYCCVYHGIQFMGRTEEEAIQKRKQYERQEQLEELIRENPTVGQYAERWLPIAKAGVRKSTYNANALHLTHLCNVIGNNYVKDIKAIHIKKVYSTEYINKSDDYIKHARSLFAAMFASAVEEGLLRSNPVLAEPAKPHKGPKGKHRAITQEERELIETVAVDHPMHAPAIVMLYAGLRPQEVKALRVEDVDFDKGVIHVRNFVHLATNTYYETNDIGKNKNAIRDVPLFKPVRDALQGKSGYLLSNKDGKVASKKQWADQWISYRNKMERHLNGGVQKRWYGKTIKTKPLLEAGTLPPWKQFDVVPYDLRHSFATWCRDNGVELHTCVEWMGHANAQMILKIYDEVSDTRSQKEADRIEKMLNHMRDDMQKENTETKPVAEQGLAKE